MKTKEKIEINPLFVPIINLYYENNAYRLHQIVDSILYNLKFSDVNKEDFYSLANEVFINVIRNYDGERTFEVFLYSCLSNKFKTEMTRRNRKKRKSKKMSISVDMPIEEGEKLTIGDTIAGNSNVEEDSFNGSEEGYSPKMIEYLNKLSTLQKNVLELMSMGFDTEEILKELHITKKQYQDCYSAIHSYKNKSILM